jgi:RND family efflux transporter MFP subunit
MDSKPSNLDALRIDRHQAPRKSRGLGWILLLLLVVTCAGTWWWLKRPTEITVQTAVVQMRNAGSAGGKTLLNASGYVTTRLEATVSSKITGKVAEILVEEGMKVEKDQILAKLDASNVIAGLRLAEAQLASSRTYLAETGPLLKFAESELERLTGLVATKAISKSDRDKVEAEFETLKAKLERQRADIVVAERQVDEWKQQLDDTIIRAPFAGVVTTKDSQPGEMISPMSAGGSFTRTGICSLVDMASLEIEVDVGESFINRVKEGQPVVATLDAYPEWKIPCKVLAIIPTADRQKATVKVRVAFEKLDPRILPQMGVKVAFQDDGATSTTAGGNLPAVPKDAVRRIDNRDIIWVLRDGKAERRAVTVAQTDADEVSISAGLSQGETVILNAPATLTDGTAVNVENSR